MLDRVFFAKTGHTIFIPKPTVVRGSFFWASNVTQPQKPWVDSYSYSCTPFRKKAGPSFIQVQEIPKKKLWGFSCWGRLKPRSFYRFHTGHITSPERWHLDHISTLATDRPWSIQLHQLHSSHGQCCPSRIPASVVEWTCFGKPWIRGSLDPPDFFKCFLYLCEKDAYRYLYKCLKCS